MKKSLPPVSGVHSRCRVRDDGHSAAGRRHWRGHPHRYYIFRMRSRVSFGLPMFGKPGRSRQLDLIIWFMAIAFRQSGFRIRSMPPCWSSYGPHGVFFGNNTIVKTARKAEESRLHPSPDRLWLTDAHVPAGTLIRVRRSVSAFLRLGG